MVIKVRPENPADLSSIKSITTLAFERDNETLLLERLRKKPNYEPLLSMVAERDSEIIGHILYYPVKIKENYKENITLLLAPITVHPNYQRQGIGKMLVWESLKQAKDLGYSSVIVLGYPEFFAKFGFKPAESYGIKAPITVQSGAFMTYELRKDALKDVSGTVIFPQEYLDTV